MFDNVTSKQPTIMFWDDLRENDFKFKIIRVSSFDNDNDNEIFFIAMKLHNVHSIYKNNTHVTITQFSLAEGK